MQEEFSLAELAVQFGLMLRGEPRLTVREVATLSRAEAGSLSFLANSRYRRQMESTRATAVLVNAEDAAHCPVAALIHPNPYLAYARIAALMHPQLRAEPGTHPSAVVGKRAHIAATANIGALAVVEDDAESASAPSSVRAVSFSAAPGSEPTRFWCRGSIYIRASPWERVASCTPGRWWERTGSALP